MATFIEIANSLAKDFVRSSDKIEAARNIIYEINSLVYSGTQTPLSFNDKRLIVALIGEFISGERPFQYADGGKIIITRQTDNAKYLDMVDYILSNLNK